MLARDIFQSNHGYFVSLGFYVTLQVCSYNFTEKQFGFMLNPFGVNVCKKKKVHFRCAFRLLLYLIFFSNLLRMMSLTFLLKS